MKRTREQSELKKIKTKPLKQKIENLKLDIMDEQEKFDILFKDLQECIQLLEASSNFTTGKLKYDSKKLILLLIKTYNLK